MYDCWITLQTALKIDASNLENNIGLAGLFSECMYHCGQQLICSAFVPYNFQELKQTMYLFKSTLISA